MKTVLMLVASVMMATPGFAQEYEFRGDLVATYLAEEGFLDKVPQGTKLNCEQSLCSTSKAVRIYVLKNKQSTKKLWSTDYCDVMFDQPETVRSCGTLVAHYDETNQLLYRDRPCQ